MILVMTNHSFKGGDVVGAYKILISCANMSSKCIHLVY
jgi:hypothetical protein